MNSLIAGKPVGPVSLGCATFGREIDEAASRELMDYALGRGVTLFDTAAAYSAGGSEQIVGRWLADRRPERLVVATKLLPPRTSSFRSTPNRSSSRGRDAWTNGASSRRRSRAST